MSEEHRKNREPAKKPHGDSMPKIHEMGFPNSFCDSSEGMNGGDHMTPDHRKQKESLTEK